MSRIGWVGPGQLGRPMVERLLAAKLVNNLVFAANVHLAAEAVTLGAGLGVDRDTLLAALAACSGASYGAATLARFPDDGAFAERARPFLAKDVAACLAELGAAGVPGGLVADVAGRGSPSR